MGIAVFLLALGIAVASAQSVPAFSSLTVPAARLPEGCHLTPPQFPNNPWFGSDNRYVAKVRPAFERGPAIQLPDGPPLSPREAAKLTWTLKGEIAEAYRASYESIYSGSVLVQAVRYTDPKWATPGEGRIVRGSTVILVTGNPQGECFKTVRSYIQSLK